MAEAEIEGRFSNKPTIDSLPTEILEKIIQFLPANERLRVEKVCRRWRCTALRAWKDIKELRITAAQSLSDSRTGDFTNLCDYGVIVKNELHIATNNPKIIKCLISRVGVNIHVLKSCSYENENRQQIVPIVTKYCRNIEEITLCYIRFCQAEALVKLCEKNKKLLSIDFESNYMLRLLPMKEWKKLRINLNKCYPECERKILSLINKSESSLEEFGADHWSPSIMMALSKCRNLRSLSFCAGNKTPLIPLIHNIAILNRLTKMEIRTTELDYNFLIRVLQHCKNLKELLLSSGLQLPAQIESPALPIPQLETLDVTGDTVANKMLIGVTKVKHLKISSREFDNILSDIVKSDDLETLQLDESCVMIRRKLFRKIVKGSTERCKILKVKVTQRLYQKVSAICANSSIQLVVIPDYE